MQQGALREAGALLTGVSRMRVRNNVLLGLLLGCLVACFIFMKFFKV